MDWLPEGARLLIGRVRPVLPTLSLLAGTGWDLAMLQRVDRLKDQVLLLATLAVFAVATIIEGRAQRGHPLPGFIEKRAEWSTLVARFCLGSVASACFVFFLHSASRSLSAVFVLVLAAVMVANRYLHTKLKGEGLRIGTLFFCGYAFFSFFWPVLLGTMGPHTVALSVISASAVSGGTALAILIPFDRAAPGDRAVIQRGILQHAGIWGGTLAVLLVSTWLNLIPPVPLSLQHGGIYRHVARTDQGYELTAQPHWGVTRRDEKVFEYRGYDRVFCFSAIFAPKGLKTEVTHVWLKKVDGKWVEQDRLSFTMKGGRASGYRGWTAKRNVAPGKWKVRLENERGRVIGVVRFRLVEVPRDTEIPLETRIYE
jgi:hypothetical protein